MMARGSFVISVQRIGTVVTRYVFCLALLGYALYELHVRPPAKLTDPFVLLAGLALLLLPDLPAHVASGVTSVGTALVGLYKAKRSADT